MIRTAREDEAEELARLISLAYRVEDFFKIGDRTDRADVLRRMKTGDFLVLEDDRTTIAGCVYVTRNQDVGYFGMLSIDPARQGQGLGRELIAAAEEYCRNAGCREMELEVVNLRTELPPFGIRGSRHSPVHRYGTSLSPLPLHRHDQTTTVIGSGEWGVATADSRLTTCD